MATGPLSSLYTDKLGLNAQLVFPSDLGSSRKGHWVTFTILTPTKGNYKTSSSSVVNTPVSAPSQGLGAIFNTINSSAPVASSVTQALNAALSGVYSQKLTQYYNFVPTDATASVWGYISLYTPDTISINQQATYDTVGLTEAMGNLGTIGSAVQAAQAGGDVLTNAVKSLGMEKLGEAIKVNPNIGLQGLNMAMNPQMEVLFTQMEFRIFQLDFLLTPRDASEAEQIKAIVQAFKFHQAPELDGSGRYYIVPSMFQVDFYFQGEQNKHLHKLAPAVLTSVQIDSAPQSWVTHPDGAPVQTRLTLQFQETEIMTKQNIESKGY